MNDTAILDSNAIISLLDGNKTVARMLENVQQVLVPAVVVRRGVRGDVAFIRRTLHKRSAHRRAHIGDVNLIGLTHVRACGFSARFAALSKRWQDEVIARHRLR